MRNIEPASPHLLRIFTHEILNKKFTIPNVAVTWLIKAVTFDLWNTLLENKDFTEHRINALSRILQKEDFQISTNALLAAYRSASNYYRREWEINHRHLQIGKRIDHILGELEIELKDDVKLSIVKEFTKAFTIDPPAFKDDVKETLEELSNRYLMGIISDTGVTPGSVIRNYLQRCEVLQFFSSTVFSDEVGFCKPDIRVFRKALDELIVKPEEAIHVGDILRTDIAGAKRARMKAVWLSDRQKKSHEGPTPDYVIGRLSELLDILRT